MSGRLSTQRGFVDLLVLVGVRILEAMFATGIIFSSMAIILGLLDFAQTLTQS